MNAEQRQRISDAIDTAHPYPASDQGGDAPAEPAPRQLARDYEGHPFALEPEDDEPTHEAVMIVSPPDAPALLADRLAAASECKRLADDALEASWLAGSWNDGDTPHAEVVARAAIGRDALHAAIDALAGIPPEARRDASGR